MSIATIEKEMAAARRILLYVTDQFSSKAMNEYLADLEGLRLIAAASKRNSRMLAGRT